MEGPQEVCSQEVIILRFLRGDGTDVDPIRSVTQVWSHQGSFIAEHDPAPFTRAVEGREP
jgi:hypothetical protein